MSDDRRAALSAAMSAASGDSTSPSGSTSGGTASNSGGTPTSQAPATPPPAHGATAAPPEAMAGGTSGSAPSRLRGADGKYKPSEAGEPKPADGKQTDPGAPSGSQAADGSIPEAAPEEGASADGVADKKSKEPPPTIKGAVREEWESIPKVAQEELVRQGNMLGRLGRVAGEARKALTGWQQVVAPFQKLMGEANPQQVAAGLFQTAAVLATGTPEQRLAIMESLATTNRIDVMPLARKQLASMPPENQAALVATLMQEHKINGDLVADFIEGKRQAPNGVPGGAAPQQAAPQTLQDPRVDAIYASIERARDTKAKQEMAAKAKEVERFAKGAEFLEHRFPEDEESPRDDDGEPITIREYMARLVEFEESHGRTPNLKKFYERACKENPAVLKIMQQREAKAKAQAANTAAQRAAAAGSSLRSEPVAAQSAKPGDRRAALAAEYAAQRGR